MKKHTNFESPPRRFDILYIGLIHQTPRSTHIPELGTVKGLLQVRSFVVGLLSYYADRSAFNCFTYYGRQVRCHV